MKRPTLAFVLSSVVPGEPVFVADYLFHGWAVEVGDRVDMYDESGCRFTYRVIERHAESGWVLTVDILDRPLVPECFYWVPDDVKPDLLEGEWGWVEMTATPDIKEALLVLRRAVRTDGWPLVVELSKRPVLRDAVDTWWDWIVEHDVESADDGESGLVHCQAAWRATTLMAELSDRQLEMLIALMETWTGTIETALEVAVRLSDA